MKTEKANLYVVTIPLRAELVQRGDTEDGATEAAAKKLKEIFNSLPELSAFIRIEGGGEALKASNGVNGVAKASPPVAHDDEDLPARVAKPKKTKPMSVKVAADDDNDNDDGNEDEETLAELDNDDDDEAENSATRAASPPKKAGGVKMRMGAKNKGAIAVVEDDDEVREDDEDLEALDEDDDEERQVAPVRVPAKVAEKPKAGGGIRIKMNK